MIAPVPTFRFRRSISEGGVDSTSIVKRLDIFEDGSACLGLCIEDAVFGERLPLQGREEG